MPAYLERAHCARYNILRGGTRRLIVQSNSIESKEALTFDGNTPAAVPSVQSKPRLSPTHGALLERVKNRVRKNPAAVHRQLGDGVRERR